MRLVLLGLCVLAASGCQPSDVQQTAASLEAMGRFEGDVIASWDADGRNMTLREAFAFVDSKERRWLAPAGSVVNGASIPAAFWTVIGGPFEGKYRNASVVHDVGCEEMTQTWEDVHRMFYEACRSGGVDENTAKVLYYAVYHFGPRWKVQTETVVENQVNANGQMVEQPVDVQTVVRLDPPPPTVEEIAQVNEFISEEDPQLATIETVRRDTLHCHCGKLKDGHTHSHDHDHDHARPEKGVVSLQTEALPIGGKEPQRLPEVDTSSHSPLLKKFEGRGRWARGGFAQFNGSGRSRYSGHDRSPAGGQERTHFSGQDRTQFSSQERTHFSGQERTQFSSQDRSQFGSQEGSPYGQRSGRSFDRDNGGAQATLAPPQMPQQQVALPAITPEETQWATTVVQQYLEKESSKVRPADYQVERLRYGYRVLVQFIHQAEDGEAYTYAGGSTSIRLNPQGQIMEMINGS
ncbi:DUF1353 domain-containing protein [Lignipirellula cremea]|nr:DUF1353 domain-containing protein [Lignipirellula cremea]